MRLRNHNATDDHNEDLRSFKKDLHSKLGKLIKVVDLSINKMPKLGIQSVGHIGKDSRTTEASKKYY